MKHLKQARRAQIKVREKEKQFKDAMQIKEN